MTDQNMGTPIEPTEDVETSAAEQPIIPPVVLLSISGVAVLVALIVALVTAQLGVVGWAALAVALLSLVLLVVLAPQQAVDVITGRSARFGGTSVIVTIIFLAVLIAVYSSVASQNWTYDVSQTDQFSLNDANRDAVAQLGADTTIPPIEIIGFYDAASNANQERTETLLADYEAASNGKITYQFINPDRQPLEAQRFEANNGSLVVRNTSNEDPEAAELVNTNFGFDQVQLTNAILAVSAGGDFRAYFISVQDGVSIETDATEVVGILQDRFNWDVQEVSFIDLLGEESEITLGDTSVDGEVVGIIGGSQTLGDAEVELLTNYLDEGGSVVLYASPDLEDPALASTPALNDYLAENFGLSFDTDTIILDLQQSVGSADTIAAADITRNMFITAQVPQNTALIAQVARSITVAEAAPANVTTYDLVRTSPTSYAKSYQALLDQDVEQTDEDPAGPLTVVAAAENTETGARVVLMGSSSIPLDQLSQLQIAANPDLSFSALVWATGFDDFVRAIPQVQELDVNPADSPVVAGQQEVNILSTISLFLLPFGMLAIGGVVWAFRRRS